jgi:hypothetical protein
VRDRSHSSGDELRLLRRQTQRAASAIRRDQPLHHLSIDRDVLDAASSQRRGPARGVRLSEGPQFRPRRAGDEVRHDRTRAGVGTRGADVAFASGQRVHDEHVRVDARRQLGFTPVEAGVATPEGVQLGTAAVGELPVAIGRRRLRRRHGAEGGHQTENQCPRSPAVAAGGAVTPGGRRAHGHRLVLDRVARRGAQPDHDSLISRRRSFARRDPQI